MAEEECVQNAMEDDDSRDDSSDSSSDETSEDSEDDEAEKMDDEDVEKLLAEIKELENTMKSEPFVYDKHSQLIAVIRKVVGATDSSEAKLKLRSTREKMSELFPLAENLWLEWLMDETKVFSNGEGTAEDGAFVSSLLERAVQDYASVAVWLELLYHSMRGTVSNPESVRAAAERAITSVGVHVAEGGQVWDTYRMYETTILTGLQPAPGSIPTPEMMKQIDVQMARVTTLFRRQLSVPLLGMENTYSEYQEWIEGSVDDQTKQKYNSALKYLDTLRPLEDALRKSTPNLEAYIIYIEHEISHGDPTRVQSIFERAVKDNCLYPDLWMRYIKYLETTLKVSAVILSVLERATRNCPWSVALWIVYLQALEQFSQPHASVKAVMSRAVSVGFTQSTELLQLWTTYLDYMRRRINWAVEHSSELEELRNSFEDAIGRLFQYFGSDGDPECLLTQYWAFVEAKYCNSMCKSRELWGQIMQSGFAAKACMWLEYARLERCFGDVKHCRKLFQKAINSVSDWPESVCQAYLTFEREEGDLNGYKQAVEKCEAQMKRVEERRAKEAEKLLEEESASASKKVSKMPMKKPRYQVQQHGQGHGSGGRSQQIAPRDGNEGWKQASAADKQQKYSKSSKVPLPVVDDVSNDEKSVELPKHGRISAAPSEGPVVYVRGQQQKRKLEDEEQDEPVVVAVTPDGFKLPPPPGFKPKSTAVPAHDILETSSTKRLKAMSEEGNLTVVTVQGKPAGHVSKDPCTAFVSNLDYAINEERIKEIFLRVGEVVEIRLVKNFKGVSKGFAYVQFKDEFAAAEARKLDRELVDGRPMFVSECNTAAPNASNKLKFTTGLEKNKLFVKGLSLTTTKEDLMACFGAHGKLKDVRIVTYRNGSPKGLAYIEYEDEACASQAVIKMDGYMLADHAISVAISNPPARMAPMFSSKELPHSSFVPSLGGGKKDASEIRGKARTQLSLVPRSVHHQPSNAAADGETSDRSKESNIDNGQNGAGKLPAAMSNDDFRSMLLKK